MNVISLGLKTDHIVTLGFFSGAAVTVTPPSLFSQGAGGLTDKRHKPERFVVTFDGKDYPVRTRGEAVAVLKSLSARVVAKAETVEPKTTPPVVVKTPQIVVRGPEKIDTAPYQAEIAKAYDAMLAAADKAYQAYLEQDEEDTIMVLLH